MRFNIKLMVGIFISIVASASYSKAWDFEFKKDEMTDRPSGNAQLQAEDSSKTAIIINCSHQKKVSSLQYRFYFNDGFKTDWHNETTNILIRVGEKQAQSFDIDAPTEFKFKSAFWTNSVRPYIGSSKSLMLRFHVLYGAEQTVKFDLEDFSVAEAKMSAHCGIKTK